MRSLLTGVPHALAQPVCDALLGEGIESRVVRPFVSLAGYGPTPPAEIVILHDEDANRALSVAAECMLSMTNHDADPEIDWSKLSPALRVACPACEAILDPRDADEGTIRCACGASHDVAELILDQHGPEAFEGCTMGRGAPGEPPVLMHAIVKCVHCGYELEGLARRGVCPECGKDYDKAVCVLYPYLAREFKR